MAEEKLIWQYVRRWADKFPGKEALVFKDRRVSYKDFYDKTRRVGKAFIMPVPGMTVDAEAVRELCKKKLANYKIPKQFEVRPLLPLLASGKVDRRALVEEVKASQQKK